ncbi:MAG: hypothetical protein ACOCWJ_06105, partial [Verrucomicrobiota bacterium]
MKHLLLLANLGLLLLVVFAATVIREHNPESRRLQLEPFEADTSESADASPAPTPDMRSVTLSKNDRNILWEKTLFNPERSEIVDKTQSDDEEQEEPERSAKYGEMELIGIGKINKRHAAIILVRERRRRGREATGGGKKNVYRVDDTIKNTGYTLVRIDKAEVEIKKGNESRILALEYGDASKQRRAEAAANDQQQRQQTQHQASTQKDDSSKPPPPPPPPPAPGARSDNDDDQDRNQDQQDQDQQDRRERIR